MLTATFLLCSLGFGVNSSIVSLPVGKAVPSLAKQNAIKLKVNCLFEESFKRPDPLRPVMAIDRAIKIDQLPAILAQGI